MRSADNVVALPRARNRRDREEVAFLPAALEIMETPPSPLGRGIAVTIAGVFCLALAWACLGGIDIVASAAGKIIPSDRTKVVQPFETGSCAPSTSVTDRTSKPAMSLSNSTQR
jgi:hemolysin D